MNNEQSDINTQHLLAVLVQATTEIAELNRQHNQKLDQHDQRLVQQDQKLDLLTDQMGRFTEGLVELKLLVHEQSETSRRQERNIEKLVGIVDKLIQERT